jgi:tetratricopeptide (TPR) repeat protein
MHRHTSAVLGALLALGGCKKSPPSTLEAKPPEVPLRAAATVPSPEVHDAGVAALQPPALALPALGLAQVDARPVDHLARARALKDEGDTLESLAEARRHLGDNPEDEDALDMVARAAQALGQNALAAAAFEKLATVRDDDAVPLVQAARMHLALKDAPGAERLASEALGRDGGNVEAYQAMGRAALVEGDLRKAMDYLEQARVLAPSHGWVLNNLGFAYLRANENAEALETLARAAELLPDAAVVQNNLGVALERLGRSEEAQAAFEKSSALAPHYTRALVNRARLAQLLTQDAGAAPSPDEDEETPGEADATSGSRP